MNKLSRSPVRPIGILFIAAMVVGLTHFAIAAEKKEARVTEVVRDVNLLANHAAPRPAALNDSVQEGTAIRTGGDSRAEITFSDQTLTRLGANTVFSFGRGAHTYDLGSGAILMSAPQNAGEVKIRSSVATAAVSGFTAMFEHHPKGWSKIIILHGKGRVSFKGIPGDPCSLHDAQMIVWPPHPRECPPVLNIDLSKLLHGKLAKGFKSPLPELNIILTEIKTQQAEPPTGGLIDPTSIDTLDQRAAGEIMHPAPRHSPPGK
jgi:hypothetical protein